MQFFKKSMINFTIYLALFLVFPLILLNFSSMITDFGWYYLYYIVVFPISFLMFLFLNKIRSKKADKNYSRDLKIIWSTFVVICLLLYYYFYYLVGEIFSATLF